jgi:subtilisin-like proprotein convertase family protein
MLRNLLLLLCALACSGVVKAQSAWLDVSSSAVPVAGERRIVPAKFRSVQLNLASMQSAIAAAPVAVTPTALDAEFLPVIDIPTPDGSTQRFQLVETPVMAPALQAQFPEIRCYTGRGVEDPTAVLKMDITPWGFHGMITSHTRNTIFIDPMVHGNTDFYVVYFKKDYKGTKADGQWTCEMPAPDGEKELEIAHASPSTPDFQGDTQIRRYRLALACTGEYATFHGGTVPLVLAAMNTSMNRVNGVYERDFAVTMQIIANNNLLVYLNAASDPYSNGDGGAMLGQNVTNCNAVIGLANYDIGHVFSTGGGGIAGLNVVCSNGKARGVTGSGAPVGDPFDIDYVAHEMGHQFGGNHTFNHCGGNTGGDPAALEPGSGTTIMAYAGICGADNVASNSEDIFHGYSIQEMGAFIYTGGANTCPVKIASGNNNPTVNAGANYTIPKSTPFALTATGSDPQGNNTLTYTWEQMDTGDGASPPTPTAAVGPLFRSYKGTTNPTRTFPRLQDLVNNINPAWEELPGVARTMNFRVTARDNTPMAGCTDEDDMVVTVAANSGPFIVTVPNTNVLWNVGSIQTITWDVANTTAAPVSCANVRILLSTDGGFTYPVVLAASEVNDGSATITVPNNVANTCRVKVEGIGNVFFDISNVNFRIEPQVTPTFYMAASTESTVVCAGNTASFNLNFTNALGFSTLADVTVTGAPAGATVTISPNPVTPTGIATVSVSSLTPAMAGNYTLTIQAVAGSVTRTLVVALNVLPGAPAAAGLTSPANGAIGVTTSTSLTWTAAFADGAVVEIATNPSFAPGTIVSTQTITGTTATVSGLLPTTVYYWRVRLSNTCGTSEYSSINAFQTGVVACGNNEASGDVPKAISATAINSVVSTLNVTTSNIIEDVNVSLVINHSYTGDLSAQLVSPTNDTLDLFDQPGVPATTFGCNGSNAALTFDAQAAQGASVLETQCNATNPSLSGTFQSITSLNVLSGKQVQGLWRLIVSDNYPEDGGALNAWSLSFCFPTAAPVGSLLVNNTLTVAQASSGTINTALLQVATVNAPADGLFRLLTLPAHGTLNVNGVALNIGDTFTQTDIDGGLVVYTHNGDAAATDAFLFDAVDNGNQAWVHNAVFNINIVANNLAASAAETQGIACPGDASGEITVTATGLDGNYTYSLNNGPAQVSNVFGGLTAGVYTVVVTGQNGLTVSANTVTLTNPVALSASASANIDDVTVTATGGTGALEYSINGLGFQPENTFNDLANGVYTITVRDANGCTTTAEVIVAVNSLLVSATTTGAVTCAGGNNGAITVNIGGGQSPYTYSLNNGAAQSDNVFTGLVAGTYTVVVTDDQGFTAVSNTVVLTEPAAITAAASAALNVVTIVASGGTGALEYSLDGGNIYQASNVFTGLTNGVYNVVVRDANGCTTATTVVVDVAALTLTANIEVTLKCADDTDGVILATAAGGIPPYDYRLNNDPYQMSNEFGGLSTGSYMVWVRDDVGTEVSYAVTLSAPDPLTVVLTVSANGVSSIAINGGVGPYSYTSDAPNENLQDLPNGTYTLVATDANGCTAETNFTIDVPALSWSVVNADATCFGLANGIATVTASGGIPPYLYSLDGGAFQSSNTFAGLAAGPHVITILDDAGNEADVTVTILQPTVLIGTATVTGNDIAASATGGTPPYQYSLNGGALQNDGAFNDLAPGTYAVQVIDANGCTTSIDNLILTSDVVEPAQTWGLTVSPNPGSGLFQVRMQQAPAALQLEVFDAVGRLIQSTNFVPNNGAFQTNIDLRNLPNGTYILRMSDGQNWGGVRLSKVD